METHTPYTARSVETEDAAERLDLPTTKRTRLRLLRVWGVGLFLFGFGGAFTYGYFTWLLNEFQWFVAHIMYLLGVPFVGGATVVLIPWLLYRPIDRALIRWAQGEPVEPAECQRVYERALRLPFQVGSLALFGVGIGYMVGTTLAHLIADQPIIEMIPKTIPAIPLVGGMMGAFCYLGTSRALHPVVAWCSHQLRHARPAHRVSISTKFFGITFILITAVVCLLVPSAYRLGQVIVEEQLKDRTLQRLRLLAYRLDAFDQSEDQARALQMAALGPHGYVFAVDREGRMMTAHPRGFQHISQERFFRLETHAQAKEGAWVDRVGQHRVVTYVRVEDPSWTIFSIAFPSDFSGPLRHFIRYALLALLEVFLVIVLFGRYYTRSIMTPLHELTKVAERIAQHGDLSQHAPVTTSDEVGELAISFNRMLEQLQGSKASLEEHARRLERTTQELAAINQEMEDLLRAVSHDLRAPLINVQGFSKRLAPLIQQTREGLERAAAGPLDPTLQQQLRTLASDVQPRIGESLQFISKGVEKMDTLLALLLAVSRVGRKADPVQPNNLDEILDDVLATFGHQLRESSIEVIRHPLPEQVPCRRNEINQVFSNLISNAIKYMGPVDRRFIEVGGVRHPDYAECYVRDTGIGIDPVDHERVFQMFARLQTIDVPGEGIGLAYVRKILRSHLGRIWVESQRGQGATFHFTLPTHQVGVETG